MAPVYFPELRGPSDLGAGALLEYDDCIFGDPTSLRGRGESPFAKAFTIRGIAEDEIEGLERPGLSQAGRVAPPNLGDTGQRQRLDVAANGAPRRGVVLDEDRVARATRQSLERKCAGAGEQVEHARA